MSSYIKNVAVAAAMLAVAGFGSSVAKAEPLMTIFEFSQPAYTDTVTTDSIVVTVTRTDQDPGAAANAFTVSCTLIGGTAAKDKDYRLPFTRPASGVWKLTFVPGVKQQSFTINTIKRPGNANKTLEFQLSEPEGSGAAITGSNATTTVTIVNPRLPPSKPS